MAKQDLIGTIVNTELAVYRGDDKAYSLTFTDSDGAAIDITGWTIFFTVKNFGALDKDDTDAIIQKDVTTHDDPTNGKTSVKLTATDTDITPQKYYFDIQAKKADGDIVTITIGTLAVYPDVTRRTS